jgi:pyruvate-ferredoxin/flavodoxin oxidoreductase
VFNLYTPCPIEHGLADDWARQAARLALESRAFPFLTYDPDAGSSFVECLSLEGNPALEDRWPSYTLKYATDDGQTASIELPLTIADWAATEGRFKQHFREIPPDEWSDDLVPFHEYLQLDAAGREGRVPFIQALGIERRLRRLRVSPEIVTLGEERQLFWSQLRQLGGLEVAAAVRERVAAPLQKAFEEQAASLQAGYAAKLAEVLATYPRVVARQLAEGLIRAANGKTIGDLVAAALAMPAEALQPSDRPGLAGAASGLAPMPATGGVAAQSGLAAVATTAPEVAAVAAVIAAPVAEEQALSMEPYIDTALCTSCNECTNLNNRLFAYDENKQAYIRDPRAGTFAQVVRAAEQCPVRIIHPGTPLNPKEKDLDKWIARAAPFN